MPTRDPMDTLQGFEDEDAGAPDTGGPTLPDWAGYALAAAGRHKTIAVTVFLVCMAAASAYYKVRRPIYRVEAQILAQRQQALPSIVRPSGLDDTPTRSAPEFIRRRENLMAMINGAGLTPSKTELRTGIVQDLKSMVGMTPSADVDDPMEALILRIDTALHIGIGDGTITIGIDWTDPQEAYRLAQAAVQTFLEARRLQEVTAIDDNIILLEKRVEALRADLDQAVEETRRSRQRVGWEADDVRRSESVSHLPPQPSTELVALKAELEAKEHAIRDMEDFRRRRILELQAQLDAQRAVYSDAHPTIIGLRQNVEDLARESPQVAALRDEERKLRQEYGARVAQEDRKRAAPPPQPLAARPAGGGTTEEPERVRDARFQYQRMVERLSAAQLELDNARAAFRYRYNVSWPARVPKEPFSPNPRKIFGLGGLGALFLALLSAFALEYRAGRVTQRWQLERQLQLPILGELGKE